MPKKRKRKLIHLPVFWQDVDIMPIRHIVESAEFQRLGKVTQLGTSKLIFRCATHTRFIHSLITYNMMRRRAGRWVKNKWITKTEAWNLCLYALLHDIGHGPFSHVTEIFYENNHNDLGLQVIQGLRRHIERCKGDMSLLCDLYSRKNPLWKANGHRALGTDKIAYTDFDAWFTTGVSGLRVNDLLDFTHYIDHQLCIDNNRSLWAEVMRLQRAYMYLHREAYFRKGCTIAQRLLQKIVHLALLSDDIDRAKLPRLTDNELEAHLMMAKDPLVKELYSNLDRRYLPKTVAVLCAENTTTTPHNQHIRTKPLRWKLLQKFSKLNDLGESTRHEAAIADMIGLQPQDVLIATIIPEGRFIMDEVLIDEGDGFTKLHDKFPTEHQALNDMATESAAVRVCVSPRARKQICQQYSHHIINYLMEKVV
jgi:HD superfamily phosphohydrolase